MRRALATAGLVMGLLVVAGCGAVAPAPTPAAAPVTAAAPAGGAPGPQALTNGLGAPEADGVVPRTVTHFGGQTRIAAEPKKVVVIATGQTDAMLTLGVLPAGVAYGDGAQLIPPYVRDAFPQYAAQLDAMPSVGHRQSPNLESIAALQPDLILANAAASKDIYPKLSAIAPTVLVQGTGVNWKQDFLLLADALGKEGAARGVVDRFEADAKALGAKAGRQTVSFARITVDRTRVFGVPSFTGFIAWDAGLARPASQQFDRTSQDLSAEQMSQADGDLVFYSVQGTTSAAAAATSPVISSAVWQNLPAVQAGHAVWVDDDPWYLNAGPTAARVVLDGLSTRLAP